MPRLRVVTVLVALIGLCACGGGRKTAPFLLGSVGPNQVQLLEGEAIPAGFERLERIVLRVYTDQESPDTLRAETLVHLARFRAAALGADALVYSLRFQSAEAAPPDARVNDWLSCTTLATILQVPAPAYPGEGALAFGGCKSSGPDGETEIGTHWKRVLTLEAWAVYDPRRLEESETDPARQSST